MAYPNEQSAGPPDHGVAGRSDPAGFPPTGFPGPDGRAGEAGPGNPPGEAAAQTGPGHPVVGGSSGAFFGRGPEWQQWFRLHQGSRRPWRRSLAVAFGTAAAISLLGVLLGLLWAWVAPAVPVINAGASGVLVTDPSPEQYIAADGWFTLFGLGFGLIVTVAAWLTMRRDRGPFLLIGVVGGTLLAGRWVAPLVGEFLGRDAYAQWRATAAQGATYLAPPELQSLGPKLVPAFVAAIVLTLLAGWSNDPDLDHPGAAPGYGPNHPYHPPYAPPFTTGPVPTSPPDEYDGEWHGPEGHAVEGRGVEGRGPEGPGGDTGEQAPRWGERGAGSGGQAWREPGQPG